MPQIQVVDTTENKPEPSGVQEFFSNLAKSYREREEQNTIDKLINDYKSNQENANAWENLQLGLEQSSISPTRRLQTQQSLNEMKRLINERDKALNAKFRASALAGEEREAQKQNLMKTGMPEWEAEVYLDAPPGVKSRIQASHAEQVSRGFRKNFPAETEIGGEGEPSERGIESRENVAESYDQGDEEIGQPAPFNQPQEPSGQILEAQREKFPEIPPPPETTPAEREKIRTLNQKENTKVFQDNHKKKIAIRDDLLANKRMQQLNDSKKLPSGPERWVEVNPKTGDISTIAKLSGKVNPETQAYVKEVNKFIRNAKDYYGARVTNFDLETFLAQLPTLSNTEQGRRLLLKQMQQESQLQNIYANKMDEALKHYGRNANIIDINKVVDEQVKDEEAGLIKKMDYTLEASKILDKMADNPKKYKDHVLIEKDGQFLSIPKNDLSDAESDGWSEF